MFRKNIKKADFIRLTGQQQAIENSSSVVTGKGNNRVIDNSRKANNNLHQSLEYGGMK